MWILITILLAMLFALHYNKSTGSFLLQYRSVCLTGSLISLPTFIHYWTFLPPMHPVVIVWFYFMSVYPLLLLFLSSFPFFKKAMFVQEYNLSPCGCKGNRSYSRTIYCSTHLVYLNYTLANGCATMVESFCISCYDFQIKSTLDDFTRADVERLLPLIAWDMVHNVKNIKNHL